MSQGGPENRGSDDTSLAWQHLARAAVTASHETDASASLIAEGARDLRGQVSTIADDVTAAIRAELPAEPRNDTEDLVHDAVTAALNRFLDSVDGAPHRDRGVDDLFRALGRAEAARGRSLIAFHAALRIAVSRAWPYLRLLGSRLPDDSGARSDLADAVFEFIEHLSRQAEAGHANARVRRANDAGLARTRLAERLLNGDVPETHHHDVWTAPDEIVVVVTDPLRAQPDLTGLTPANLVVRHLNRVIVIAHAAHRDTVVSALGGDAESRIAVSWPVSVAHVSAAYRWARRTLTLAERGVIDGGPIIDCREHRTQIWLHSEPALRQQLCQDLLSPLLAETPNSREILSETLLVWLETRDSAPAIAAQLGVHPQTIRYRWKRINELFGDALHVPEFIVQITMLLKASVPLWKAGDQSDFERFRAEENR